MNAAMAEYTGTLVRQAEARTRVIDHDGHTVPVLCVELQMENALHTLVHAEQRFPEGHHAQAAAAAHRLPKGTRITLQSTLADTHLFASNTVHIHVNKEAACPQ